MVQIGTILSVASYHIDLLDAEILLAHVLKQSREFVIAHVEDDISFWQTMTFKRLVKKRKQNIPVAYLTGKKDFYGLEFAVNTHTLVPRPETELMVDCAMKHIQTIGSDYLLVDVGTGSGCIPISIIHFISKKPLQAFAIDISKKALQKAKQNLRHLDVPLTFLRGNLLSPILQTLQAKEHPLIITANLPYITEEQFQSESSIWKEPHTALVADDGGLALYDELLEQLKTLQHWIAYFEIDPTQTERITQLINEKLPNATVRIHQDLCGRDRIVEITLK